MSHILGILGPTEFNVSEDIWQILGESFMLKMQKLLPNSEQYHSPQKIYEAALGRNFGIDSFDNSSMTYIKPKEKDSNYFTFDSQSLLQ